MTRTPAVMEIELKPCPVPWCGGEATTDWYDVSGQPHPYWVRCKTCGCKTPMQYATVAEAIAAWNTRTPAEPLADGEMIEKVAKAIHFVRDETNREERERLWPDCRLVRIEQAQCAIAAYNPNDRLREALEAAFVKGADVAVFLANQRQNPQPPTTKQLDEIADFVVAVRAALSHKD